MRFLSVCCGELMEVWVELEFGPPSVKSTVAHFHAGLALGDGSSISLDVARRTWRRRTNLHRMDLLVTGHHDGGSSMAHVAALDEISNSLSRTGCAHRRECGGSLQRKFRVTEPDFDGVATDHRHVVNEIGGILVGRANLEP